MNQLVLIENFSCQFIIVPTALVLRETKIIIMTIDRLLKKNYDDRCLLSRLRGDYGVYIWWWHYCRN